MGDNTQIKDEERGVLGGVAGMLVTLVILLTVLTFLTYYALKVQQNEASNYYKINQDVNALTSGSLFSDFKQNTSEEQRSHYHLVGSKK